MVELLLILGKVMPKEMVLEKFREALDAYEKEENEQTIGGVTMMCQLFIGREIVEKEGLDETMKDVGEIRRIRESLNTIKS